MSKLYDLLSDMCGKIKKPDFNQNDPTAPDYVKNRPFYKVTFTMDSSGALVADKTYQEMFDAYIAGKNVFGVMVNGSNDFSHMTLCAASSEEVDFFTVIPGGIVFVDCPRTGANKIKIAELTFNSIE